MLKSRRLSQGWGGGGCAPPEPSPRSAPACIHVQYRYIVPDIQLYVAWTFVYREFFTIFGQCINVLNYKAVYVA